MGLPQSFPTAFVTPSGEIPVNSWYVHSFQKHIFLSAYYVPETGLG